MRGGWRGRKLASRHSPTQQPYSDHMKHAISAAERAAIERAAAIYAAAEEWPRCLQGWPATAEEEQADWILRSVGGEETLGMPSKGEQ